MIARRSLALIVPIAFALAGVLPAVIVACDSSNGALNGGSTPPPASDGAAATDGAPPSSGDDAPVSIVVDSAVPDTSPLPLNSVDAADIPEGGTAVTQGVIHCGGSTCNAFASLQCCVGDASTCQATSVACPAGAVSLTCNESADCVVGKACCGGVMPFDGGVALSAQCAASCGTPALPLPQLCRTNGECGDGGACVVQTCSDGNRYELCGVYKGPPDGGSAFTCTAN